MTLVFDSAASGHHAEYINHVMEGALMRPSRKFLFLLSAEVEKRLNKALVDRCEIIFFDFRKAYGKRKSSFRKSLVDRDVICGLCKARSVDHILFLNIDPYQYVINTRKMRKLDCTISGILFSPYIRKLGAESRLFDATAFRKYIQLVWMTSNAKVSSVFVLNDSVVTSKLNETRLLPGVFHFIPDPVNIPEKLPQRINRGKQQKVNLLIAGSITPRKNIARIVKAMTILDGQYKLQIVGKSNLDFEGTLEGILKDFSILEIERVNRFVSDEELYSFYQNADIVMVPYLDFYYSSGVLNTAAYFNVPVICGNYGLMGHLTNEYNLGVTVDVSNPLSIAEGVQTALNNSYPIAIKYLEERSIAVFQRVLLDRE